VKGTIEVTVIGDNIWVENIDLDWVWHDGIDARSPKQWYKEEFKQSRGFWGSLRTIPNGIVESGLWWGVMDLSFGVNFGVEILWKQQGGMYKFNYGSE
jgi:hypothetical protein